MVSAGDLVTLLGSLLRWRVNLTDLRLPSDCSECIWSRTPRLDRWLNGSQSRREGPVLFWVEEVSFRGSGIMTGLSHFPREIKSSFPLDCPAGENVWMRRVGVSATSSRRHPLWRPARYRLMGFWDLQGKNHGMCCVPTLFPVPQWATILKEFNRVNRKPWGFLCRLILYRGCIYFGWVTEINGKANILKRLLQTYSILHQLRLSLLNPSSLNEPSQMRFGRRKN